MITVHTLSGIGILDIMSSAGAMSVEINNRAIDYIDKIYCYHGNMDMFLSLSATVVLPW